jgi:predicted transcriptional regulator YheO
MHIEDKAMVADPGVSEQVFLELRRKVCRSELLSASVDKLLSHLQFNGKLSVIIQNGQIVKSGYEEGYFKCRNDASRLAGTSSPTA